MALPVFDFVVKIGGPIPITSFYASNIPRDTSILPAPIATLVDKIKSEMASAFGTFGQHTRSFTGDADGKIFHVLVICWANIANRARYLKATADKIQPFFVSFMIRRLTANIPSSNTLRMQLPLEYIAWLNAETLSELIIGGQSFEDYLLSSQLTG